MIIRKKFPETVSLEQFCDDNDITITVTSGRDSYGDLITRAGFLVSLFSVEQKRRPWIPCLRGFRV